MATMKTHISWTHSTWNPTTGCTQISAGCDNCYAKALFGRELWPGRGPFETVKTHPDRLGQVRNFTPFRRNKDDLFRPRLVFVNSMSDLMHDEIPDSFRDQVFDKIAERPSTVFQILTKRAMTMKRYIGERFPKGVPANVWLGVSVEDNRVKGRIDQLRRLKDQVGDFTAFLSVEPLIGPCDKHDYTAIDWVLIGGESGANARDMPADIARTSRDLAHAAGAAVWFKQFGKWANNPLYREANSPLHIDRVRHAIRRGEILARIELHPKSGKEIVLGEKGGATLDGRVWHDLPPSYNALAAAHQLAPAAEYRRAA